MYVWVIGDARQELGRRARPRFSPRTRNRHDGRVRTRQTRYIQNTCPVLRR